jgi:hypothetical protein
LTETHAQRLHWHENSYHRQLPSAWLLQYVCKQIGEHCERELYIHPAISPQMAGNDAGYSTWVTTEDMLIVAGSLSVIHENDCHKIDQMVGQEYYEKLTPLLILFLHLAISVT